MKTTMLKQAERGKLLVSEPFLPDPCFKRTVVLLSEHNEEGTVGFILNKPTEIRLNDGVQDFPDFDVPLYFGGPVQTDTLHYIHKLGGKLEGSKEILPGIYWGGDFETLKMLVDTGQVDESQIRFFVGYSRWLPNQLNLEIRERAWIVSPGSPLMTFFEKPRELWSRVLRSLGREYAIIANFPEDPALN